MAFDMKVFEDLLGADMSDEYRSLLGNISGNMATPGGDATASIYGFEPGRHTGVKSLAQQIEDRDNKWFQDRTSHMMRGEQENAVRRQKAQENLRREALLQSARNQLDHAGQISATKQHAQLGLDKFNSAMQQEKLRQDRGNMGWGQVLASGAMNGMLGMMGPLGSLAKLSGDPSRKANYTTNQNIQGALDGLQNYSVSGKKLQPQAAAAQQRQQPNAQQRQQMMQQMLRGSFGK